MTNKETATALFLAGRFIGKQEETDWFIDVSRYSGVTLSRYFDELGDMTAARRALGGKWDKVTSDVYFTLKQSIGENISVELRTYRNVACTPRVVGTEVIEVKDYSNVPSKIIERDIVEWDCNPVLDA